MTSHQNLMAESFHIPLLALYLTVVSTSLLHAINTVMNCGCKQRRIIIRFALLKPTKALCVLQAGVYKDRV